MDALQARTLSQYGADLRFDDRRKGRARAALTPNEQLALDELLGGRGTQLTRDARGDLVLNDDGTGVYGLRDESIPDILNRLASLYEGRQTPPEPPSREALAAPQSIPVIGESRSLSALVTQHSASQAPPLIATARPTAARSCRKRKRMCATYSKA